MGQTQGAEETGAELRPDGADSASDAAWLDDAGMALFRLGRMFGRQSIQQRLDRQRGRGAKLSHILVVQSVERAHNDTGEDATVGVVAGRLAIDPSTASRVVGDAIRAGFLARAASSTDGRAVRLALTERGRTLAAEARQHQRSVFERLTRDWSDDERLLFAGLFVRFTDALTHADHDPGT